MPFSAVLSLRFPRKSCLCYAIAAHVVADLSNAFAARVHALPSLRFSPPCYALAMPCLAIAPPVDSWQRSAFALLSVHFRAVPSRRFSLLSVAVHGVSWQCLRLLRASQHCLRFPLRFGAMPSLFHSLHRMSLPLQGKSMLSHALAQPIQYRIHAAALLPSTNSSRMVTARHSASQAMKRTRFFQRLASRLFPAMARV